MDVTFGGSLLSGGRYYRNFTVAQLGERQTEDLKVPGSNPESSYEL